MIGFYNPFFDVSVFAALNLYTYVTHEMPMWSYGQPGKVIAHPCSVIYIFL
jgi:hypothetical protein